MRLLITFVFALFSLPALAAGWGSYENARFGYVIDVPPDFEWGEEAANGDGRVFTSGDGTQTVTAYGGNIIEADFETSITQDMNFAEDDGWALSYQRVTPSWASYSGLRSGMVLYTRTIALCDGAQFASFEFVYPERALKSAGPLVDRMVRSLRATGKGVSC